MRNPLYKMYSLNNYFVFMVLTSVSIFLDNKDVRVTIYPDDIQFMIRYVDRGHVFENIKHIDGMDIQKYRVKFETIDRMRIIQWESNDKIYYYIMFDRKNVTLKYDDHTDTKQSIYSKNYFSYNNYRSDLCNNVLYCKQLPDQIQYNKSFVYTNH